MSSLSSTSKNESTLVAESTSSSLDQNNSNSNTLLSKEDEDESNLSYFDDIFRVSHSDPNESNSKVSSENVDECHDIMIKMDESLRHKFFDDNHIERCRVWEHLNWFQWRIYDRTRYENEEWMRAYLYIDVDFDHGEVNVIFSDWKGIEVKHFSVPNDVSPDNFGNYTYKFYMRDNSSTKNIMKK